MADSDQKAPAWSLPAESDDTDYAALGYPETGVAQGDLEYAAYCVGFASRGIAASVIADELNAIQKDIRSDTDSG